MPIKLTDAIAKAEPTPAKGYRIVYDSEVKGLGLRVTAAGARVFAVDYQCAGRSRRYTIGDLGDPWTVGMARKHARELKHRIALGEDPQEERTQRREQARAQAAAPQPDTISTVIDLFLASLEKKDRAPRYVTETRRLFTLHVLPRIGDRSLAEIDRKAVIAMLDAIAEGGTSRRVDNKKVHAAGGPIAANRVLSAVRALFNYAIRRDLIAVNPCTLIERPGQETARDRVLTGDEIRELYAAFDAAGPVFSPYFKMLLLTGQRRSESAGMRWADVNLDEKTWTIPADQNKSGRIHVLSLAPLAVALIQGVPRKSYIENGVRKPSDYVFTSDGDVPISGFSRAKAEVEAKVLAARRESNPEAAPMAEWTIHDLRRTAATEMSRLGISEAVISRILNHAKSGVTSRHYNHYEYLTEKRHALDLWSGHLERLMTRAGDNVVALHARERA